MAARRKQTQAQPRRKAPSGGAPGWVWMLGGFLPGLFLAGLVHLHHERQTHMTAEPTSRSASEPSTAAAPEGSEQRPRFEFYKLLSEMEVVVPDDDPAAAPGDTTTARIEAAPPPTAPPSASSPTPSPPASAPADDPARYVVQAGSFRNHGDADRLKARLALLGVEAEIQSVRIEGGDTFHRVRIGPMSDRQRVEDVRRRLQEEQVESILLRLQG
ncbi:cell division protein FtsN [Natronocella acetinitrilica]|uniref:Cell division protein FtsN n=1 Tax=Natronocella acetinitrilica TaxID=414046 RepID=A0AAE3G6J2_9GAMM|nr:SPOR domain-containing protein [Natronocella acetinitrilica]MCP1676795.1 cell division protein FtsN [Natronocella acetinitrilica]